MWIAVLLTARYPSRTVPIYDFKCASCEAVSEHILLGFDAEPPKDCPSCGEGPLTRVYAGARTQISFNGWGFSKTDGLIADTRGKDFKALKERAARIVEE